MEIGVNSNSLWHVRRTNQKEIKEKKTCHCFSKFHAIRIQPTTLQIVSPIFVKVMVKLKSPTTRIFSTNWKDESGKEKSKEER